MCVYKICPCKTTKSFQTSIEKYCALKITLFNDSQFRRDFKQVFLQSWILNYLTIFFSVWLMYVNIWRNIMF